jgi:hypothetical protein
MQKELRNRKEDTGSWSREFGVIYVGLLVVIKLFRTMAVCIVSEGRLIRMQQTMLTQASS